MAVAVGPGPELLEDPRRLADGRIHQSVAESLRARALLLGITGVPVLVVLHAGEPFLLELGQVVHGVRAGGDHVDVNGAAMIGVAHTQRRGHRRAPVAALGDVARVAEAPGKVRPGIGDLLHAPAGGRRLAGEAVAGQGRADHVEGILGIAAVADRIGQRRDHLEKLDDGARPAVGHDQRQRVGFGGAHVQEVDVDAVDGGDELLEGVDARLGAAPVVLVLPVLLDLLHIAERHPLGPVGGRLFLRQPGERQPGAQIVELLLGYLDAEGCDVTHGLILVLKADSSDS